ncbi:MAG: site-2 protease family protein [Deltaproteobacteria bacterium]|jgi:Zn-dependent protease|nr:site-2 protease family protein [Deltaproteobacteria bacterium]
MGSQDFFLGLQTFGLAVVPALFGIICHEVAHGWVACKLGDPTAKLSGRLTLNPLPHIDPLGFGVFAVTALSPSPLVFGWAKPVPIQPRYFRSPRQGMILVSLAGPLANILVALLCAGLLRLVSNLVSSGLVSSSLPLTVAGVALALGVIINCALACFNLIPVPPLDGSHILSGLLPRELARWYEQLGRYGLILVVLLLLTGVLSSVLVPCISLTLDLVSALTGLDSNRILLLSRLRF